MKHVVIGSKRVHSYATVKETPSDSSQSQVNGGFDVSTDCNWTTFGSDIIPSSSSYGTVSTIVHDASIRSTSTNNSTRTQFTWLLDAAVSFGYF